MNGSPRRSVSSRLTCVASGWMTGSSATSGSCRRTSTTRPSQRSGEWRHIWRVVGRYANISILDVHTTDRLDGLLPSLPLFPYLDIRVTPLATHPKAIRIPARPKEVSARPRPALRRTHRPGKPDWEPYWQPTATVAQPHSATPGLVTPGQTEHPDTSSTTQPSCGID
jgi:muconolactone D-isomerase